MDKLKAMNTFVHVAEHGSLTAAADALDLSLPAVVRSLAALEASLGVRLVNRTTRRLVLTSEGAAYLVRARAVLAAVDEAEAELAQHDAEPRGRLTVTAPVMLGQLHVAPAVTRFVQRHPRVEVSLQLQDRMVDLHEEQIDVGVRIGRLPDSGLAAWKVGMVRRVLAASPSYLRRCGTPRRPDELREHNCLRFSGLGAMSWTFFEGGETREAVIRSNLEFNHVGAMRDACVAGAGLAMFLSYQVAEHVAHKRLKILLADFEPPPAPIQVVVPHGRLLPRRTSAMVEWLRRELAGIAT